MLFVRHKLKLNKLTNNTTFSQWSCFNIISLQSFSYSHLHKQCFIFRFFFWKSLKKIEFRNNTYAQFQTSSCFNLINHCFRRHITSTNASQSRLQRSWLIFVYFSIFIIYAKYVLQIKVLIFKNSVWKTWIWTFCFISICYQIQSRNAKK